MIAKTGRVLDRLFKFISILINTIENIDSIEVMYFRYVSMSYFISVTPFFNFPRVGVVGKTECSYFYFYYCTRRNNFHNLISARHEVDFSIDRKFKFLANSIFQGAKIFLSVDAICIVVDVNMDAFSIIPRIGYYSVILSY